MTNENTLLRDCAHEMETWDVEGTTMDKCTKCDYKVVDLGMCCENSCVCSLIELIDDITVNLNFLIKKLKELSK